MFFLFIDGRINRLFRSKNQQTKKEFLARTFFWISFQAKKTKKKPIIQFQSFFFQKKLICFVCLQLSLSLIIWLKLWSYYESSITKLFHHNIRISKSLQNISTKKKRAKQIQ